MSSTTNSLMYRQYTVADKLYKGGGGLSEYIEILFIQLIIAEV